MIVFTSGEWNVKSGREADFRRVWAEFGGKAEATEGDRPVAVLLQDKDDPRHFRSFGRWPSEQASSEWQSSAAFMQWMASLRETLETMESYNLEVAETVGRIEDVFAASR
jgi:heme-degrading monooxygenase HmoA